MVESQQKDEAQNVRQSTNSKMVDLSPIKQASKVTNDQLASQSQVSKQFNV